MVKHRVILLGAIVLALASTSAATTESDVGEMVATLAARHAHRLDYRGGVFSGPAWDLLLAEGRAARFVLLGEEHGIAENPRFAAALFAALVPAGYSKFAIEVSPQMATTLERAAADGLEGLRRLFVDPTTNAAFFGMLEEAEMLVALKTAVPGETPVLWGLDYEVMADRHLIARLESTAKPAPAEKALATLRAASDASWTEYERSRDPRHVFSFAGDPALVAAVRDAWPGADAETRGVLDTLEETLVINRLWVERDVWASNARRAALIRENFLRYWRDAAREDPRPKVFFKLGASHLVRGRSMTEVFDLGTLLPEVAALEGGRAFHLLVLPGKGATAAVFDPTALRYRESAPKDGYAWGLKPIVDQAAADAFTLIDLRPLRPLLSRARDETTPELMRMVHGYDAVLVMSGSTASRNLLPAPPPPESDSAPLPRK